jgi:hypothetical protein
LKIRAKHPKGFLDISSKENTIRVALNPGQTLTVPDSTYYDATIQSAIARGVLEITENPVFLPAASAPAYTEQQIQTIAQGVATSALDSAGIKTEQEIQSIAQGVASSALSSAGIKTEQEIQTIANSAASSAISTFASSSSIKEAVFDINLSALGPNDDGKILVFRYLPPDDYGNGEDGDVTISSTVEAFNKSTDLIADVSSGGLSCVVTSATDFSIGNTVMIHQVQIYRGGTFGLYEINKISGIAGNVISFLTPLGNSYYSDAGAGSVLHSTKSQLIKVPNYRDLAINARINAKVWDGRSGGVIAFRCSGTLSGNQFIYAEGKGFGNQESQYGVDSAPPDSEKGVNALQHFAQHASSRPGAGGYTDGTIAAGSPTQSDKAGYGFGPIDMNERLCFGGGRTYKGGGAIWIYAANCTFSSEMWSCGSATSPTYVGSGGGSIFVNTPTVTYTVKIATPAPSVSYGKGGDGGYQHSTVTSSEPTRTLTVSTKTEAEIV